MTSKACLNTKLQRFELAIKSQGHNSLKIECSFLSDCIYFLGPDLEQRINDD